MNTLDIRTFNFSFLRWKFSFNYYDAAFLLLIIIFSVVASLQSIAANTHYFTNNADLGFHNQLMYKFAHFKRPSTTLWGDGKQLNNCFGDHMTMLMPINSQLYWIFGKNALLVAQIGYCILGAVGIYKLVLEKCKNYGLALGAVFLFFSHYSLYAALTFDAHDNVYGMMFLPWMFYFFYKDNLKWFLGSLAIFLLAREDLALTGIFTGISLLLIGWKGKKKYGLLCSVISLVYFLLAFKVIIPRLSPIDGDYTAWRFASLGNTMSEVILNIIKHPGKAWGIMTNHEEKIEKLNMALITGGALIIFQPRLIFVFIPTLFTTLFSDTWILWGNFCHYNIVFAVMLPIVVVFTLQHIKPDNLRLLALQVMTGLGFYALSYVPYTRWTRFDRIFTKNYYEYRTNRKEIKKAISLIPQDASVCTTNYLTPHIAFRDKAYMFPNGRDSADYILINEEDKLYLYYPFESPDAYDAAMKTIYADTTLQVVFNQKQVVLFKRKGAK